MCERPLRVREGAHGRFLDKLDSTPGHQHRPLFPASTFLDGSMIPGAAGSIGHRYDLAVVLCYLPVAAERYGRQKQRQL